MDCFRVYLFHIFYFPVVRRPRRHSSGILFAKFCWLSQAVSRLTSCLLCLWNSSEYHRALPPVSTWNLVTATQTALSVSPAAVVVSQERKANEISSRANALALGRDNNHKVKKTISSQKLLTNIIEINGFQICLCRSWRNGGGNDCNKVGGKVFLADVSGEEN